MERIGEQVPASPSFVMSEHRRRSYLPNKLPPPPAIRMHSRNGMMPALAQPSSLTLPPGRHFTLTWGIPENWGGMTAALLHRSRMFAEFGETPVSILTLDNRDNYRELETDLRATGELLESTPLLNLWDWLRMHNFDSASPRVPIHIPLAGTRRVTELFDKGQNNVATDHRRDDGSLVATVRQGADGKRNIVLYDQQERPSMHFGSTWALYRMWLDKLTQKDKSWVVADSKTASRFLRTYRRDHVVTMHVVHGSHRSGTSLAASRRPVLDHMSSFDSIVLLTQRQKRDIERDFGPQANLAVIPNSIRIDSSTSPCQGRARGRGVMLASLTPRKRVAHAIEAIARAARHTEIRLDVYGTGPLRGQLQASADKLSPPRLVVLHGHRPDAATEFHTSDFSLLTSAAEGLPLVLLESMAAGCIPFAYDIPYGPSDLITDGIDGYLIQDGQPQQLAARLHQHMNLTDIQLETMRTAARARASQFDDTTILKSWITEMQAADARRGLSVRSCPPRATLAARAKSAIAHLYRSWRN